MARLRYRQDVAYGQQIDVGRTLATLHKDAERTASSWLTQIVACAFAQDFLKDVRKQLTASVSQAAQLERQIAALRSERTTYVRQAQAAKEAWRKRHPNPTDRLISGAGMRPEEIDDLRKQIAGLLEQRRRADTEVRNLEMLADRLESIYAPAPLPGLAEVVRDLLKETDKTA